jgi:glycosyltransferase involved in cell wall biosynthesis
MTRVAVYSDFPYRRHGGEIVSDESFVLFLGPLAERLDRVVALGRLDPTEGPAHHRLPEEVDFAALPHYPALSGPRGALRAGRSSLAAFERVLDGVDAVWLMGPTPLALAFAAAARRRGVRVVLGVREDFPAYVRHRHPARPDLLAAALTLEASWRALASRLAVVAIGSAAARRYQRSPRVVQAAVSLVTEADIVAEEEALTRDAGVPPTLLSVGRLSHEKNPLLMADVLAVLRAGGRPWRLVACGEGPLRDALAARARDLGVAGALELPGYEPLESGLWERYRAADALLHVSWTEGAPQVLLEAFASGLPVVATDVGGVTDLAGGAALLVVPGDAAAAARAVVSLEDPELRARLVRAGLARARAHTAEREAARVAAVLAGNGA